ncbi:MAG: hypothetical protein ABSE48_15990 [Verrucomicrobiota bacterium]
MSKLIYLFSVCCFALSLAVRADTLTLADGTSLSGDILKFDGNGLMLRLPDNTYTNLEWGQFSQDSLKQLSQNQKIAQFAEPFIEPTEPERPAQAEIVVKPVSRLERPAHPSLIIGFIESPVGLLILLALYAANLVAAYEISLYKMRNPGEVMGLSAILPLIGPVIFLVKGEKTDTPEEVAPAEAVMAPSGSAQNPQEEIPIVEVTRKTEEKKPESQIYARGKFTFNKRFVETKFADFTGVAKGDALKFTMELKTAKEQFTVERIMQIMPADVMLETVQRGQVTLLLSDILEIKLIPKPTAA